MTFTAADELAVMLPRVEAACATDPACREDDDVLGLDAVGLIDGFRRGSHSPGEVVDRCLDRLDGPLGRTVDDGGLGAIASVDRVGALAAAEISTARWRAGAARPLEGVPVVVKDLLDTAGLTTTGGSRWLATRVPTADAAVVTAARAAGAVIIAKTITYELGCGNEDTPFGRVANPWNREHITGGSSAGSAAALAARIAPLALGTDTGGSIRIPSAFCGTVGLKPTLGRLSTAGLLGLAPTLDTAGPMARTALDAALLFAALTHGPTPDAGTTSLRGTRVGVLGGWFTAVLAADVAAAFAAAVTVLGELGAELVPIDISRAHDGAPLSWLITMAEAAITYADAPRDRLSAAFVRRLEVGDLVDPATYRAALGARRELTTHVVEEIAGCDVVVAPACVSTAPPFTDVDRPVAGVPATWPDVSARTMALWNVTGLPALAVPIGFGDDGLPIGMQIAGAPFADESCLAVGATYQTATDHHLRSPQHEGRNE